MAFAGPSGDLGLDRSMRSVAGGLELAADAACAGCGLVWGPGTGDAALYGPSIFFITNPLTAEA